MGKEEIIERLEEIAKHAVHVLGEEPFFMSLDDGIAIHEAIDILKSAQPEPHWIPCSERLPEESDLYCVSGKGKVWICEFHIIPNFISGWRNDVSNPVVQAWMPLPEPYKEE